MTPYSPEVMLIKCREKFQFYAEQHDAKGTPESSAKAEVNRDMIRQINETLVEMYD